MHAFDLSHVLLAKHAQHIVLVHFPIALVFVALGFDLFALRNRSRDWSSMSYYNLCIAAVMAVPVAITGLLAWQWQLEAAPLKGVLRLHLILGLTSCFMIWGTWAVARRQRRAGSNLTLRLLAEFVTVAIVGATAHLGGIVSGVSA